MSARFSLTTRLEVLLEYILMPSQGVLQRNSYIRHLGYLFLSSLVVS